MNKKTAFQIPRMAGKSAMTDAAEQAMEFAKALRNNGHWDSRVYDSAMAVAETFNKAAAAKKEKRERHVRVERTTLADWRRGDTDGYLPDLWGRSGLLEETARGPKPKDPTEHRIVTSGLGDTVNLACDCGWREKAPRSKAEAVASAHYNSPDGVRSVLEGKATHKVDITQNADGTHSVSCSICSDGARFHSYSEAIGWANNHVTNPVAQHILLGHSKALADATTGNIRGWQIACCCGWKGMGQSPQQADQLGVGHVAKAHPGHSISRTDIDNVLMVATLRCKCGWTDKVRVEDIVQVTLEHLQQP